MQRLIFIHLPSYAFVFFALSGYQMKPLCTLSDAYMSICLETGNLDSAYDIYECIEEESLARLRDADDMSEGVTDNEEESVLG